jgi:hypothetical protein
MERCSSLTAAPRMEFAAQHSLFAQPRDRVRVRRVPQGVLLEPLISDPKRWFEELDRFLEPLAPIGQRQPATPRREIFE